MIVIDMPRYPLEVPCFCWVLTSHIREKFGIFQYAHFELPLKNIHALMLEASLELFRIFWFLAIRREIRPFLDMPSFVSVGSLFFKQNKVLFLQRFIATMGIITKCLLLSVAIVTLINGT